MKYTKNYHLPQWVKEDRIMMEDFNQMCADMEAGLVRNKSSADAGVAQAKAAAASAAQAAQAAAGTANAAVTPAGLREGLFRPAYNQCSHFLDLDEAPVLNGAFVQRLGGEKKPDNSQGIELHQDGVWCASSGPGGTIEDVQSHMTMVSPLESVKGNLASCKKCVLTFAPTGAVCIQRIGLNGYTNDNDGSEARFKITLDNKTRGVRELETELTGGLAGKNHTSKIPLNLFAYLHGGDFYQLEIIPLTAGFNGTFRYAKGDNMTIERYDLGTGSFSGTLFHTFGTEESGLGGLLAVRYAAYHKKAALTASWGGGEQTPFRTRRFTDSQGQDVIEAEFRFNAPISGGSTATLKATVQSGGDVIIYNWFAALL